MHVKILLLTTKEMKYVAEREVKVLLQGRKKESWGKKKTHFPYQFYVNHSLSCKHDLPEFS